MAVVGQTTINEKQVTYKRDDYGAWVCVQNYEHYAGENPSVAPGDTFPQLPNGLSTDADVEALGASGELRHVDDIDQYGSWNVDAVRLEGYTANHDRVIDFFTTNQTVIDAVLTEQSAETNYTDYQGDTTTLTDAHSANLPAAAGDGNADTRSDRIFGAGFPFYNGGTYHWAVAGTGNRWEVDDYPDNASNTTVHRVWVRVPLADLPVDTAQLSLPSNSTTSETLTWETVPGDDGDYTATVASETDSATTSATIERPLVKRFATATGAGDAVAARSTDAGRGTVGSGAGDATPTRTASASRGLVGTGDRGDAAVSRALSAVRTPTGAGVGAATASRIVTATERALTADGAGDATVARTTAGDRALLGTGDRGDAAVSRTATASRDVLAEGGGDATVAWLAPHAWALPRTPGSETDILLTPSAVSTTADGLTLATTVTGAKREFFDHYRRAGDVTRQSTAFGAFRRIRRDGDGLLTVRPPAETSPPFADRRIAPVDMSAEQVAPRRHNLSLTLGLAEPRAREPIEAGEEAITADTESVAVAAGETERVSLSWTPTGTQLGDWAATVSSPAASDSTLVTVSDAPWGLAWPVATLSLTEARVGQVSRTNEAGVAAVTLPLRLEASQVATILAVGSRIDAVETRQVPDAGNIVADTLPDSELTCTLGSPDGSDVESGTYVLRDWSVEQARPGPPAYDATVTLVRDT